MPAYYNEIEPYAAQWLRNLIASGHIAPGDVDERSILEVRPDDLRGYTQCHFFAGLGGWSYAMRLAGWPDDRPVWTGSCPCQPFSAAGKQRGSDDERHLWPAFFDLIRECGPGRVFGEQVAGAAGLAWLDHLCADMEDAGYAVAAANLPACSVGAPQIRNRLFWVANANNEGCERTKWERQSDAARVWPPGAEVPQACSESLRSIDRSWPPGPGCIDEIPMRVDGVSGRVGKMRAYGNAIVPQVAAVFVMANV